MSRWEPLLDIYGHVKMELHGAGKYVLYTDHLAAIAEKDKEIERLKIDAERYRRVRRLSVNEFNNIFARNISGHQSFDSCIDEIENFVLDETVIDDGFGNSWSKTCPMCHMQTMQIVRPGKVQCSICG